VILAGREGPLRDILRANPALAARFPQSSTSPATPPVSTLSTIDAADVSRVRPSTRPARRRLAWPVPITGRFVR
jgi:hypothetical protein